MKTRTHKKIVIGQCPVCGHYGSDCNGRITENYPALISKPNKTKKDLLINKAIQSLIDLCSDAHELEDDLDANGKLAKHYRRAYVILDKMEKQGLVEFVEKNVYAKILQKGV